MKRFRIRNCLLFEDSACSSVAFITFSSSFRLSISHSYASFESTLRRSSPSGFRFAPFKLASIPSNLPILPSNSLSFRICGAFAI
jgi:hypothetical protein